MGNIVITSADSFFLSSSHNNHVLSSLLLSFSLSVRHRCLPPLPLLSSSLHLHLSCSSGNTLWANRKPRRLVTRPPVPAPPLVFSVNPRQHFPSPNIHFHPLASYICCSPRFAVSLLQICIYRLVSSFLYIPSCCLSLSLPGCT